ncbi:MAG TPA: DUF885 domain-containing protein [Thermoplasmata archaeon]|nr:DUF885 domain-containing protein [Thermoplasmata archaeon]
MPDSRSPAPPSDPLASVEAGIVDHLFELQPSYAVFLGLHQYDGRLPDFSRAATTAWAERADELLRQLAAIPAAGLPPSRQLDHLLLRLLLEGPLFDLRDARELERNPMSYVGPISLTPYMVREYAPLPQRVDAIVHLLDATPRLLVGAHDRLDPELPEPFLRLTFAMAGGLPAHFAEAEAFARSGSATLAGRVAASRARAEAAVHQFVERLHTEYEPRQTKEFALGSARYQRLLWVREGVTTPFAEVEAAGWADLRRNQGRLEEIARTQTPPIPVADLMERFLSRHTTADGLIPLAQRCVDETKAFVRSKDLVTVPEPSVCRVAETPVYGRALSTASMNPPGPFDVSGDEGIYFVTPVDSSWTPERQEEWLRSLNDAMLRNITVHEVYPGHYLQFLHFRQKKDASLVRKVFFSSSFVEGWAHYCEQLVIEAGLSNGSVDAEVAQIHDALLRDCRLLASIAIHTQGKSLDHATELFMREGHMQRLPAEREAIRGTFNPEYFCYTLGKLAILDVRERLLASTFRGSRREFHDALLGFGAPPVGVLEALLTGH